MHRTAPQDKVADQHIRMEAALAKDALAGRRHLIRQAQAKEMAARRASVGIPRPAPGMGSSRGDAALGLTRVQADMRQDARYRQ